MNPLLYGILPASLFQTVVSGLSALFQNLDTYIYTLLKSLINGLTNNNKRHVYSTLRIVYELQNVLIQYNWIQI
jgi:hypothetical protein